LCLAVVISLALLVRTQHISDISLHYDECCSWKISQFPWDEMLDAVSRDAHPPVYYVLMHALGMLGGDSPAGIRGYSVFFGLATMVAAFWFVRTALGNEAQGADGSIRDRYFASLLAAALVGGSALQIEMSLQARPYTLGTFLTLVSASWLLRGLRPDGRAVDWIGFALAATILSLIHYYCLFTVGAEFLFAGSVLTAELWRTGWVPSTKRIAAGVGLSAWGLQLVWLLWSPVFSFQRERSTSQLWMQPIDWHDICANCWWAFAGRQSSQLPLDWQWLAVAGWSAPVVALLLWGTRGGRLAALCAGLPLAASVAYGLAVRNILGAKYLIFAQVFLLVALTLSIAGLPWRPGRMVLALGLLAWTEYGCWQHFEIREHQARYPGIRGAVAYLEERRAPHEPIIVGTPFVSIIVQNCAKHPQGIYVRYRGDHRRDLLGGPPLREEEYREVDSHLSADVKFAWTIDVFDLYGPGNRFESKLPSEWVLVGQENFRELYEQPCVLAVRAYRRTER
jgi:hypothetical protein